MRESALQHAILVRWGMSPKLRLWRANVGVAFAKSGRAVRFGVIGQGDISGLVVGTGRRVEIEVKAPGGVQSAAQRAFGRMVVECGGLYLVAYEIENFSAELLDALTPP